MIVFFGPAGAGKSMQGQILAARHGWRWLSTGQLLRDSQDKELHRQMEGGNLVSDEVVNKIVVEALTGAKELPGVILDGYPRNVDQAKSLLDAKEQYGQTIELAVVIDVPREDIIKRLMLRGRADDTTDAIEKRLDIYKNEIDPILKYLDEHGVPVAHVAGHGTVGQVHDRIEDELVARDIVEEI